MKIDFDKMNGLVPAIVQDVETGAVLMLGFMNDEALQQTRDSGRVTFFSRSKQRLWTKGETSGHVLHVHEIRADCDHDTLLIKATPAGPVCHTGADTCFAEANPPSPRAFLAILAALIRERKLQPQEGSYTSALFARGINKIAQKVGEEAVELVIEAKDDDPQRLREEAADLVYHLLVLLEAKGASLDEVVQVLAKRHQ